MGIALENVSFTYQEGTPLASTALSDVSLTIADGSYTALSQNGYDLPENYLTESELEDKLWELL